MFEEKVFLKTERHRQCLSGMYGSENAARTQNVLIDLIEFGDCVILLQHLLQYLQNGPQFHLCLFLLCPYTYRTCLHHAPVVSLHCAEKPFTQKLLQGDVHLDPPCTVRAASVAAAAAAAKSDSFLFFSFPHFNTTFSPAVTQIRVLTQMMRPTDVSDLKARSSRACLRSPNPRSPEEKPLFRRRHTPFTLLAPS